MTTVPTPFIFQRFFFKNRKIQVSPKEEIEFYHKNQLLLEDIKLHKPRFSNSNVK